MSNVIKSILDRLVAVEAKITPAMPRVPGLNSQQKAVGQLPALFKPKSASPVLGSKTDPKNPLRGKLVGDSVEPTQPSLAETMQEIEEDMLGKVKRQFVDYLERLEDRSKIDKDLVSKAKQELGMSDTDEDVAEDDFQDTEVAHDIDQKALSQAVAAEKPVKTVAMEDGAMLEIYGDESRGFEIRRGGRSLPTRFPNIDHADMAVQLFQQRRRKQDLSQDYVDEA
jgi:uncharacterized protein (UPF0335 family)